MLKFGVPADQQSFSSKFCKAFSSSRRTQSFKAVTHLGLPDRGNYAARFPKLRMDKPLRRVLPFLDGDSQSTPLVDVRSELLCPGLRQLSFR